jgi:ferritin-like metal-binding protein YciE
MPDSTLLVPWLNDAYAMESALIQLYVNHARDAEDHPGIRARLEEQVETSRRHAEQLKECLLRIGSGPSVIKTALGSMVGAMEALSMDVLTDEAVHDAIADYAAVNYSIATYKVLVVAAEDLEDYDTAMTCRAILREEEEMARWLEMQIPPVAVQAVTRDAGPTEWPLRSE